MSDLIDSALPHPRWCSPAWCSAHVGGHHESRHIAVNEGTNEDLALIELWLQQLIVRDQPHTSLWISFTERPGEEDPHPISLGTGVKLLRRLRWLLRRAGAVR